MHAARTSSHHSVARYDDDYPLLYGEPARYPMPERAPMPIDSNKSACTCSKPSHPCGRCPR